MIKYLSSLFLWLILALNGCGGGQGASGLPASNVAPTAQAGGSQSVVVGGSVTLDATQSTDANADPLIYKWVLTSKPAGSAAALSNNAAVKPTFIADRAGSYVFSLIVNDGKVDSVNTATVTITAAVSNLVPVANAGSAQNVLTNTVVALDGSGSTDANGDALTYAWTLTVKPSGSNAVLSSATDPKPTFTANKAGGYTASLVVSDGKVNSPASLVVITAATTNIAPVANAGIAQNVNVGSSITLNGSASSDANGDSLVYIWSLTSKPAGSGSTLSDTSLITPTFIADKAGTYVAQLIVSDGKISSTPTTVTITVTIANAAPVANAGVVQNVTMGTSVTLDGSASSDANNDALSYSWTLTGKPLGSSAVLTNASSVKPTFVADIAGTYVATLVVSDGKLSSTAATVAVTAAIANVAPIANAGIAQNVTVGMTVTLDGSVSSDANSDALSYSWTLTSKPLGSNATLSSVNSVKPTFVADIAGTYVATLIVSDGKLSSSSVTTSITASPRDQTKLGWPINCTKGGTCGYIGYPDIDGDGKAFNCGQPGYTRHEGTDISISQSQMDNGVDVYAAADGVVLWTFDGKYDNCPNSNQPDCITPATPPAPGTSSGTDVSTPLGPYCKSGSGNCWWTFSGGNVVVIRHTKYPGVFATRYDHLKKYSIIVTPGQTVTKGQKIAQAASAGKSTGAHLHFEVWGTTYYDPVDPWAGQCGPNRSSSLWDSNY